MLPAYKLRNLLAPAVKASDSRPDKARQRTANDAVVWRVCECSNEHMQTGWLRDGCFVTQDLIDAIIVHTIHLLYVMLLDRCKRQGLVRREGIEGL